MSLPPPPSPSPPNHNHNHPATLHPNPKINTYHCLCSTLLLATPYDLSSTSNSLPRRAPPALDRAIILPLVSPPPPPPPGTRVTGNGREDEDEDEDEDGVLPSLLTPNFRPGRKVVVVRRADGFERRRVWRCGRCGVGVGYEVLLGAGAGAGGEGMEGRGKEGGGRVLYLIEGGLVGTEEMGREEG